jgi:hypothetical protein
MPEALEAEKRDAVKFTSGIENQKPRAVMLFGALFFASLYGSAYGSAKPLPLFPAAQGTLAEAVGFEPTKGCPSLVFKTSAFNHSATLPTSDKFRILQK